jgi:YidC/Oxa1 family membrane protein insertase
MLSKLRTPFVRSGRAVQSLTNLGALNKVPLKFSGRCFSAVPSNPNDPTSGLNFDTSKITASLPDVTDLVSSDEFAMIEAVKPDSVNMISSTLMSLIDNIHVLAAVPYWEAIVIATIGVRICMFPLALKTVQGAARMATMRPVMQVLQDEMKTHPNADDPQVKMRFQMEMKEIFKKHEVNPFMSFLWPFAQFPIFIGQFIALREMGNFYPDYASGGCLWFNDLSAMDPTYVLPVLNSLSFLVMIEIGSDGMAQQQTGMFKNIMRGMAVVMVPLTAQMPAVRESICISRMMLMIVYLHRVSFCTGQ